MPNLIATAKITIQAPVSRVWHALVDPEIIKQYLFGTEIVTTWQVGSPIVWKGIWQDKPYEDLGTILAFVPEKYLQMTYWSSMSGLSNDPKNFKKVTYELTTNNQTTTLTLTQDNNQTEEEKIHSEQNWTMVLNSLAKLLETV